MSISIAINIGSPNSTYEKVKTTISSIMANIGTDDYKIIIAIAPYIKDEIKQYIYNKKNENGSTFDLLPEADYPWADFINEAIDRSQDSKYFIKSHDDIELLTHDFYHRITNTLDQIKEPVGWISFTDKDFLNGHWAPSTRPGFHKDFIFSNGWNRKKLFQFHSLPDDWWKPPPVVYGFYLLESYIRGMLRLTPCAMPLRPAEYYANLPYDFPERPVKCHAPFNHFVLIEMDKLKHIGKCEKWSHISLMVDEDWGLRALQLGLSNVWMPDIEYVHYRPFGGSRASIQIAKMQKEVHQQFRDKWGFNSDYKDVHLSYIEREYRNTNIPWSIDRNSFDWDYIK